MFPPDGVSPQPLPPGVVGPGGAGEQGVVARGVGEEAILLVAVAHLVPPAGAVHLGAAAARMTGIFVGVPRAEGLAVVAPVWSGIIARGYAGVSH